MLGLRFCARAFPASCGKRGPLFIVVRGPLTIVASLVAEHRLSSCGSWVQSLRGMWDLPRPGLEPVSPALADRLSTTAPPGKPLSDFLIVVSLVDVKGHPSNFYFELPWLLTKLGEKNQIMKKLWCPHSFSYCCSSILFTLFFWKFELIYVGPYYSILYIHYLFWSILFISLWYILWSFLSIIFFITNSLFSYVLFFI